MTIIDGYLVACCVVLVLCNIGALALLKSTQKMTREIHEAVRQITEECEP